MNDIGVLQELIGKFSNNVDNNNKLSIALLIFMIINILMSLVNILSDHKLKNKEKKIFSFTLKEKRRIEIFEKIYQLQDKLTFYDGRNENNLFLIDIQDIQAYVGQNKLYLSKKEQHLINEINDYFKTVLTNYRTKDYRRETELFTKMEGIFRE
jgi:hypothetical protein